MNQSSIDHVTFEATPNPGTYKFNFSISKAELTKEFTDPRDSEQSPLASKLFGFPWVAKVYIGESFVSVTKKDWVDWAVLAQPLSGLIQEHLNSGAKIIYSIDQHQTNETQASDPIVTKIKTIILRDIQPVVALDGGEIVFHSYKDQTVFIQMKGACAGCPSSTATLKEGIEVRIKELVPEVKDVVAIY